MRAIRFQKLNRLGKPGPYHVWHFLTDEEGTRCGLDLTEIKAIPLEERDLEKLPPVEACQLCARTVGDDVIHRKSDSPHVGLSRYAHAVNAPKGRISKHGPLRQTGKSGHGNPLQ
jgi:hypothetical protein